jgi:hypothetical protein
MEDRDSLDRTAALPFASKEEALDARQLKLPAAPDPAPTRALEARKEADEKLAEGESSVEAPAPPPPAAEPLTPSEAEKALEAFGGKKQDLGDFVQARARGEGAPSYWTVASRGNDQARATVVEVLKKMGTLRQDYAEETQRAQVEVGPYLVVELTEAQLDDFSRKMATQPELLLVEGLKDSPQDLAAELKADAGKGREGAPDAAAGLPGLAGPAEPAAKPTPPSASLSKDKDAKVGDRPAEDAEKQDYERLQEARRKTEEEGAGVPKRRVLLRFLEVPKDFPLPKK